MRVLLQRVTADNYNYFSFLLLEIETCMWLDPVLYYPTIKLLIGHSVIGPRIGFSSACWANECQWYNNGATRFDPVQGYVPYECNLEQVREIHLLCLRHYYRWHKGHYQRWSILTRSYRNCTWMEKLEDCYQRILSRSYEEILPAFHQFAIQSIVGLFPVCIKEVCPISEECYICNEMTEDWVQLPCKHAMHRQCLIKWIGGSSTPQTTPPKYRLTCPLCRRAMA